MGRTPDVIGTVLLAVALSAVAVGVGAEAAEGAENRLHVNGSTVEGEVTFELTAPGENLNYWDVAVEIPDDARVTRIEDGLGEIEGYELDDGRLEFSTNTGVARSSERVTVEYVVENATVERYGNLRLVEMGFVGFGGGIAGETTRAEVTAEESVLSTSPVRGFDVEFSEGGVTYTGEGSGTVRVAVGDGNEYGMYEVFGEDADLSDVADLYDTVPAAFGFEPPVRRHPVVVMDEEEYGETAEDWSGAQYRAGGAILVRESDEGYVNQILHETAHAYNDYALSWSDATVGWFEEGTAGYVEFLADRRRGEVRRALFAGERLTSDGRVAPRGTVEELVDYYESDGFMRGWKPSESSEDQRRFGYAFAELVVRSYVKENGAEALRETYDELRNVERRATTTDEASVAVEEAMGDDILRPCEAATRDGVTDCLERVNRMDAVVPAYGDKDRETYGFDETDVPEEGSEVERETGGSEDRQNERDNDGPLAALWDVLAGIADFLRGLIP